jgi:glycosyltransferase involved in cell wall biosynthesis
MVFKAKTMIHKMNNQFSKILLIGPLPPGWGGARVSFKLFFDYVIEYSKDNILHYDLPVRHDRDKNPPGHVNYLKTFIVVLFSCIRIPFVSRVIVFGSKNFCFSYGLIMLLVSKIFRKPFYIRFFGGHPAQNSIISAPIIGAIVTKLMSMADKLIVETYVGADEFPRNMQGKISVVVGYRPAINFDLEMKNSTDKVVKFVYTGAISNQKGVGHLLDAFNKIKQMKGIDSDVELHLFGAGKKDLVEKCNSLERVCYHGRVSNLTLRKDLSKHDIFVFPSIYENEGHPGSVIEALMAGLPVIASNLTGVSEVVKDRQNGILVDPGDVEGLAEAMGELIKNSSLCKELANGALKSSKEFDALYVIPKLVEGLGIKI